MPATPGAGSLGERVDVRTAALLSPRPGLRIVFNRPPGPRGPGNNLPALPGLEEVGVEIAAPGRKAECRRRTFAVRHGDPQMRMLGA
ncbi:MAG: hypothetical protein KF688_19300 [Pirellulales bacterium]|nr:hypothetical protein [Pirellulales bacterium]